jgi:hypothetical protein
MLIFTNYIITWLLNDLGYVKNPFPINRFVGHVILLLIQIEFLGFTD